MPARCRRLAGKIRTTIERRLLHALARRLLSQTADRERAKRLAALYRAAHGPEQALIDRWATFIQQSRAR